MLVLAFKTEPKPIMFEYLLYSRQVNSYTHTNQQRQAELLQVRQNKSNPKATVQSERSDFDFNFNYDSHCPPSVARSTHGRDKKCLRNFGWET